MTATNRIQGAPGHHGLISLEASDLGLEQPLFWWGKPGKPVAIFNLSMKSSNQVYRYTVYPFNPCNCDIQPLQLWYNMIRIGEWDTSEAQDGRLTWSVPHNEPQ